MLPGTSEGTSCSQSGSIETLSYPRIQLSTRTNRTTPGVYRRQNFNSAGICRNPRRPQPAPSPIPGQPQGASAGQPSRRRAWVERVGAVPASTPMWTSRASWIEGLRAWATTGAIRSVCRRLGCSITAATLLSVATAMADYADYTTGRNVAVTRKKIAQAVGCDARTVTTAWKVLRDTRWAVEASRGHGSAYTPSIGNRPSVWHLTPRRTPSAGSAAVQNFHLPTSGGVCSLTPVGSNSPSTRKRVAENQNSSRSQLRRRRGADRAPRPLALQRLVAELVQSRRPGGPRLRGLNHQHLGGLCDAITSAGLDVSAWSADALVTALEQDMAQSGTSWPDHVSNPAGFLRSRLLRLPARPAGNAGVAGQHKCEAGDPKPDSARGLGSSSTAPAHLSRAAIADCAQCDSDGYRGVSVCDHVERKAVHAAGIRTIYQVLARRRKAN